ncbi:MAG: sulfate adenylyltransferase subunit 1 [Myxococcaceae bacterium]
MASTAAPALSPDQVDASLEAQQNKELVRFVVVGSVDDGKSTFIGRLLYETHGLYDDQVAQVKRASKQGGDEVDFSLFTDGLKAEREQAITIDVAYRYFSTQQRKYIIADTPGHVQYTRNMATGASTADVAVILVDARHGLLPQGRRHAYIASLLGIPELIVAVNKMDLVGYDVAVFESLRTQFAVYAQKLGFRGVYFVPVSARLGDNVVTPSERMPWHRGGTVLERLETVQVRRDSEAEKWRFPVQYVLRPHLDYRGFAGQVASGSVEVGDEVVVLPSGRRTRVKAIEVYEGGLQQAAAPRSVTLRLADEVDVSRGDLLVRPSEIPKLRKQLDARIIWFSESPLDPSRDYLLKHGARIVPARVEKLHSRTDLETLQPSPARELAQNDIGHVTLDLRRAIVADAYEENRQTGAFILVDPLTNGTLAAGLILDVENGASVLTEEDASSITAETRAKRLGHRAAIVAAPNPHALEKALFDEGLFSAVAQTAQEALALADAGLIAVVRSDQPLSLLKTRTHSLIEGNSDLAATLKTIRAAV